jgi:ABC-type uncharacterized transport system permease subunit
MTATIHAGGWLFYLAAAAAYLVWLAKPWDLLGKLATGTLAVGFLGHTACFVYQALGSGMAFSSRALAFSVLSWGISGVYLATQIRGPRLTAVGAFVAPVAAIFAFVAEAAPGSPAESAGELPGWWLPLHIATLLFGYAFFAVSFCVSVVYLIQERFLKERNLGALFRRLPSLDVLDRLNQRTIVAGFGLLSIGLLTGLGRAAIVPVESAEPVWQDPTVIVTAAMWLWYAFAVQSRLFAGWRGRKAALFAIVGFATLLLSFVGMGLATGFHVFT